MAVTAQTKASKKPTRMTAAKTRRSNGTSGVEAPDATKLLEADHQEVEGYFEKYEGLKEDSEKKALATKICQSLKVHTQIEEEIFYPFAREATHDDDLLDEATVEHAGAKSLIAEIEAMKPGQDLYDAKIKVLSEQIHHHVEEEEEELFPEVRKSGKDLNALGSKMAARKAELTASLQKQ